jgi:ribose 5-phosphate isomerase B
MIVGDRMKIGIASDHRGFKMKAKVTKYLKKKGYNVIDYGTDSAKEKVDYPDFGIMLGEKIMTHDVDYGIAICSNGVGIAIACNKVKGVRCGKVDSAKEAAHAKAEDDINAIAISADKFMFEVKDIIDAFLSTPFSSNTERYVRRIKKLNDYEEHA